MKIVVIGGTGTIGKEVVNTLKNEHEVITVGNRSGDYQLDITSKDAIKQLFDKIPNIDGVISTAGSAAFGPLEGQSDDDFLLAVNNKLMGQVNLVREGIKHIKPNGFITLTSGILAQEPMPQGASVSLVNAGLEAFAKAAALETPNNIKVNVISPSFVTETMEMMGMDSTTGISAADTAKAYQAFINSEKNGTTLKVRDYLA